MSSCFWGVAWRLELRQGRWRFTSCARGHAATVPSCSVAPGMCCRERVLRRDWHLDQWAPRAAAAPPTAGGETWNRRTSREGLCLRTRGLGRPPGLPASIPLAHSQAFRPPAPDPMS